MSNLPKKLITSLIIFLAIFTSFSFVVKQKAFANPFKFSFENMVQNEKLAQEEEEKTGKIFVFIDRVIDYYVDIFFAKLACKIIPCDVESSEPTAVTAIAQGMDLMYDNPPASVSVYAKDLMQNANLLARPAYAQGIGFSGLSPLLHVWKVFRNIAYTVLIVVMVAIGFMIIFRMKIDPKTVISIQAALPKIIIVLILITLSYPIAGFLIDIMYMAMAVVIGVLASAVPPDLPAGADFIRNAAQQQQEFMNTGLGGVGKLFSAVFNFGLIPSTLSQALSTWGAKGGVASIFGIVSVLMKVIGGATKLWHATAGGIAIPIAIIVLIVGLGLLFTFIRLFMILLNSYIQVLITIVLAPLLLLQEAIPGKSAFGQWIANLVANLVVFPATVAVIYLSWLFSTIAWKGNLWGAPMLPSGGGQGGSPLAIVIGLGIIFMAPSLVVKIKKIFKPKPTIPVSAGSIFAPLTGSVQSVMGTAGQFYYLGNMFQMLPFLKGKGGGGGAHRTS